MQSISFSLTQLFVSKFKGLLIGFISFLIDIAKLSPFFNELSDSKNKVNSKDVASTDVHLVSQPLPVSVIKNLHLGVNSPKRRDNALTTLAQWRDNCIAVNTPPYYKIVYEETIAKIEFSFAKSLPYSDPEVATSLSSSLVHVETAIGFQLDINKRDDTGLLFMESRILIEMVSSLPLNDEDKKAKLDRAFLILKKITSKQPEHYRSTVLLASICCGWPHYLTPELKGHLLQLLKIAKEVLHNEVKNLSEYHFYRKAWYQRELKTLSYKVHTSKV